MSLIDFIAAKPGFCLFWAGLAGVTIAFVAYIIGHEVGFTRGEDAEHFRAYIDKADTKEGRS